MVSNVEALTTSIKSLTSIIKDIQETGKINLKHGKTSANLTLTKSQVGQSAFDAIISCIEELRAKDMENLNKILTT